MEFGDSNKVFESHPVYARIDFVSPETECLRMREKGMVLAVILQHTEDFHLLAASCISYCENVMKDEQGRLFCKKRQAECDLDGHEISVELPMEVGDFPMEYHGPVKVVGVELTE